MQESVTRFETIWSKQAEKMSNIAAFDAKGLTQRVKEVEVISTPLK
jgi:hypothetical protein